MSDQRHVVMLVANDVTRDARVKKEALSAASAGYSVTVLGVQSPDSPLEEYWPVGSSTFVRIERVALPLRGVGNAFSRRIRNFLDMRRTQAQLAEAAIALRPDLVHANDFDTLPAGVAVKRATSCALLYDSHELYVELFKPHTVGPVEGALLSLQKRIIRAHEARIIGVADSVITVNPLIARELVRRYGIAEPGVVMNTPPLRTIEPLSPYGLPRPIFIYQGGFTRGRGLTELAEAFSRTRKGSLVFMGWGPLEKALKEIAARPGSAGRIAVLPPVAPDDVVRAAAAADVGLIPYRAVGLNNYLASPNKLFDYLHAGVAIIASDLPFIRSVIEETGAGSLVGPEDADALVTAMDSVVANPELLARQRTAARAAAPRYSWDAQASVLREGYAQLLHSPEDPR